MQLKLQAVGLVVSALLCSAAAVARADKPVYGPPAPPSGLENTGDIQPPPPGLPPVLVSATELAVETHPTVAAARANRRARAADLKGAKWLRFPSLTVQALALTPGSKYASNSTLTPNITIEEPVYTAGRIGGTIEKAKANLEASESTIRETQLDIATKTVQAYFSLALASESEDILTRSLSQTQSLVETITHRVDQEVSPKADLDLALSRAAQIQQQLASVKGQKSEAYSTLLELIGQPNIDLGNVPHFDPRLTIPTDGDLVKSALECSPTIARLRHELAMAQADRKVAKGSIFPQVLAQLSHDEITGTRAGIGLQLQTGNGLSQLSAVSSADAQIQSAQFAVTSAERQVRQQVLLQAAAFDAARSSLDVGQVASTNADQVTESYQRQFIAGRRTWLDVMNAVREAMSSQLTQAQSEIGAMSAASQVLLETCKWQPMQISPNQVN